MCQLSTSALLDWEDAYGVEMQVTPPELPDGRGVGGWRGHKRGVRLARVD